MLVMRHVVIKLFKYWIFDYITHIEISAQLIELQL